MKFKVKLKKRSRMYVTFFACIAGLWLLVTRFGLSVDDLIHYGLMCGLLVLILVVAAAFVGGLLRLIKHLNER